MPDGGKAPTRPLPPPSSLPDPPVKNMPPAVSGGGNFCRGRPRRLPVPTPKKRPAARQNLPHTALKNKKTRNFNEIKFLACF